MILFETHGYQVSEGKLSRIFGSIDPMEPELEAMLRQIILGIVEQPTTNSHDKKGESNE
jgi:hypothetical protein